VPPNGRFIASLVALVLAAFGQTTPTKIATTTTLTSGPNPSTVGQAVDITATVSPSLATGEMLFLELFCSGGPCKAEMLKCCIVGVRTAELGRESLSDGKATFSTSSLSAGVHWISATYVSDQNSNDTTAFAIKQTVNRLDGPPVTVEDHPVRCQGKLEIPQTYHWDLDDGAVSHLGEPSSPPYDVWYEAVLTQMHTTHRYLVPKNGAALAVVGNRSVGFAGCRSADYTDEAISLDKLQKGTFICAQTDEGRYSEFSFDDLYPESSRLTLKITYTTWEQ
jgi:Bacterial Ig-like domain (group 3)